VMGAAAPAVATVAEDLPAEPNGNGVDSGRSVSEESLRSAVLNAVAGQRMLVSMLETGSWKVEGGELVIQVAASATVIDMSLGADARRLIIATASGLLGRPVKVKVLPGGPAQVIPAGNRPASNGSGRGRAEQDPIVRRMQEKFGAEIRTIIDYKDRK
jgi:DNA polymerase III subunit gamma/tau